MTNLYLKDTKKALDSFSEQFNEFEFYLCEDVRKSFKDLEREFSLLEDEFSKSIEELELAREKLAELGVDEND